MLRKGTKDTVEYAEQIVIYEAGSNRTAFIGTWKAIALFQFGVCTVWLAPHLYLNENQPDKSIRVFQTIGGTSRVLSLTHTAFFTVPSSEHVLNKLRSNSL
jgi:hypothetical protein